jgi:transposase
LSIAEAAQPPNIHFVRVKSSAQQDLQLLGRIRERLIAQRTTIINQVRGLAREYGVNFAKTRQSLAQQLPAALADATNELTPIAREALAQLAHWIRDIDEQLEQVMRRITALPSQDPAYARLRTIPDYRPGIARQPRSCAAVL